MKFNTETADWVYETISKMDDEEARFFTLLLADNLHEWEIEHNARVLRGAYNKIAKSLNDDLARYFLAELERGSDPEKLVAQAAAVSVSKAAHWENTWYQYQQRDNGGKFGSMSGNRYISRAQAKAGKKAAKAQTRADILGIKAGAGTKVRMDDLRAGKYRPNEEGRVASAGEYGQARATAIGNQFADVGQNIDEPVRNFGDRYHQLSTQGRSNTTDALGRLEASGNLVTSMGLMAGKPSVAAAGQAAALVGHYGPEAEKVVGPGMRKAAYRYRGTERTPDKALRGLTEQAAQRVLREEGKSVTQGSTATASLTPPQRVFAAEEAAINYMTGNVPGSFHEGRMQGDLRKKNSRVPSAGMANLHRQSGKVTPSEGIMIDADGKVIAQAVGYGEDHYIPFNLKNLGGLKGGSYVRTRESGGLTSEDIYTGLLSGARSMTVVSNSGVFTLHFDDDLRGGRRYNDKAKQMVGRYEHILDAIQSKQVENPARAMSPAQKAQIRIETEDKFKKAGLDLTDEEMDKEVQTAIKERAKRPKLSPEEELGIEEHAQKMDDGTPKGRHEANEWRYGAREQLLERKAGQNYKLDGEGYKAALLALKEQFPYYVDDVEYITNNQTESKTSHPLSPTDFKGKEDKGYVKPRYNRPAGAQSGYFDESIQGRGKHGADTTNYQNWAVARPKAKEGEEKSITATSGSVRDRVKAQNERGEAIAQENETKAAVKSGADLWARVNRETKDDPPINERQHPKMAAYLNTADDDKEAFLRANHDELVKELKVLGSSSHAQVLAGKGHNKATLDPVGEVERKHAKPKWDENKLSGTTPPEKAMGMSDEEVQAARSDAGVQKILEDYHNDDDLKAFSAQTRANIDTLKAKGRPEHEIARAQAQVKRIEQARAVKAREIKPSSTPTARLEDTQDEELSPGEHYMKKFKETLSLADDQRIKAQDALWADPRYVSLETRDKLDLMKRSQRE